MLPRHLASPLLAAARRFPVVAVTGPRQSGKTTLVRRTFPDHRYVSLELPDVRRFATEDPQGFLAWLDGPAVLDEAQRAPELFSYLQVAVDEEPGWRGRFVLTGSSNFLLHHRIAQSLAGRVAVLHLLPFAFSELQRRAATGWDELVRVERPLAPPSVTLEQVLVAGGYPPIHDRQIPPWQWCASYYQTYIERDVRELLRVGDLEAFDRFVRLCAGRSGQVLDLSALGADAGVSHTTARRWLSVLEASFLVMRLPAYHARQGKRLVRRPKLYMLDTGLLCFLLGIEQPQQLWHRSERGAVFETFVVSELYKHFVHEGRPPRMSFWRPHGGAEVDVVLELADETIAVEAKSGRTVAGSFFRGLESFARAHRSERPLHRVVVYGGDELQRRRQVILRPWFAL